MVDTTAGRSGWSPFSVKDDTTHVAIICGRFDGENLLFASIVLVASNTAAGMIIESENLPQKQRGSFFLVSLFVEKVEITIGYNMACLIEQHF